jgi:hypothetical protein
MTFRNRNYFQTLSGRGGSSRGLILIQPKESTPGATSSKAFQAGGDRSHSVPLDDLSPLQENCLIFHHFRLEMKDPY